MNVETLKPGLEFQLSTLWHMVGDEYSHLFQKIIDCKYNYYSGSVVLREIYEYTLVYGNPA